ncbi:sensor histidine kinase [Lysobacter solisilvae (ex Woo and Kim 2022)]|uniref:Histidine kinase n=1 Tax=Agrilutibacter terrestris TaxID=2865112 RepID=A0A7H0FYK5_9GAMM|nr:histidine kinase [Lysobacter terrestris]QNP41121.1 histidine kinase [Lysobacter terrestris]
MTHSRPEAIQAVRSGLRRLDPLDRTVLALTLAVWAMHYVMRTMLSLMPGDSMMEPGTLTARTVVSLFGVAVCLAIHAALKKADSNRPWRLLGYALALSLPAAMLVTWSGEYVFRYFTNYYEMYPDRWMTRWELGETYKAYQWNFFAWCALYAAARNNAEMRRREQQLADATNAAQQAQLLALRLQVNPHFLFNTLNTLAGLIVLGRAGESEKMVLSLSRFLRYTLARTPSQLTTLADEVGMLRQYLEIEAARFSDRLKVTWDIPQDCLAAMVPSLILLPLVENALKYGLGGSDRPVEIAIGARRDADRLFLSVADDGGSAHGNAGSGLGIGLSNARQRLAALYGDDAALDSGPLDHGWRSVIQVPWQEELALEPAA